MIRGKKISWSKYPYVLYTYVNSKKEKWYNTDTTNYSLFHFFYKYGIYFHRVVWKYIFHEWLSLMIIFIPQDENKSSIYRKKLEFFVYYILSDILNNLGVIQN